MLGPSPNQPIGHVDRPVAFVAKLGGRARAEDVRPLGRCGVMVAPVDVTVEDGESRAWQRFEQCFPVEQTVGQAVFSASMGQGRVMHHDENCAVGQPPIFNCFA